MTSMTTNEILTKAADYMEEHGKARGYLQLGEAVCAIGAVRMVMVGAAYLKEHELPVLSTEEYKQAIRQMTIAIDSFSENGCGLTQFSDTHDKTEVVEMMRKAADLPDWSVE